jgi:hypothetical protein
MLTGITTDISSITQFVFWEPVYYATAEYLKYDGKPGFPSAPAEAKGRFVGFGESVGDVLTYKILTDDTKKIIYRSYVRSALNPKDRNLRLDPPEGESSTKPINEVIRGRGLESSSVPSTRSLTYIDPNDILNRTYLTQPDESGQRFRARVVQQINQYNDELKGSPEYIKFLVTIDNQDKADEIISYNDIVNFLEEEMSDTNEPMWKFKDIIGHQGPLRKTDPSYKGSSYNVMVEWEDGSKTYEPLDIMAQDCAVICAIYAKRNNLLDTPGWKRFKSIAKNEKKMLRMVHQAKLSSFRHSPQFQFGFQIPRSPKEAIELDKRNGKIQCL